MNRSSQTPPGDDLFSEDLFSVDIDGHLARLPSSRFPSRHGFIAEMIRLAIRSGARTVRIETSRTGVSMEYRASPPDPAILDALEVVYSPGQPEDRRRSALALLDSDENRAYLAPFATPETTVVLSAGGRSLTVGAGAGVKTEAAKDLGITRYVIHGRPGRRQALVRSIRRSCRFCPTPIVVDKAMVSRRETPEDALAWRVVVVAGTDVPCLVWIPREGDSPRAWFLDTGVVWGRSALKVRDGRIFEFAVETRSVPTNVFVTAVSAAAAGLYHELAAGVDHLSESDRRRFQELLFFRYRTTGRCSELEGLPLFETADGSRLSLAQLLHLSRERNLQAVMKKKHRRSGFRNAGSILVLDDAQADFLSRDAGIRLRPPPKPPGLAHRVFRWCGKVLSGSADRQSIGRGNSRRHPHDCTGASEALVQRLVEALSQGTIRVPSDMGSVREVRLVSGRRGAPARILAGERGPVLEIRQDHPLAVAAAEAVWNDPENLSLAVAALTQGRSHLAMKSRVDLRSSDL